jgi:putative ABC transport system permease protein
MSVWRLIIREIRHRWISFLLSLVSVAVAVACLVGSLVSLRADDIRTTEILGERQQEVEAAGVQLEDAMRKITKGLGFNILVLSDDEPLNDFTISGIPQGTMPYEFVTRLAESKIVTVNHLLPIISRKIDWPEMKREVVLTGTQGEIPIAHRPLKKPLQDQVPAGTMVVGHNIHSPTDADLPGLQKGDKVQLMGRKFEVTQLHEQRGTVDDSTVWINLTEAQEMLGMQNLVNAVLALECNCATVDRVGEIRAEIASILPGTTIIERGPPALARAEARNTAQETAEANLKRETQNRDRIRKQRESFSAILVPLVLFGAGTWIGLLALNNVRQRSSEIGILRAIGLKRTQILATFLGKSLIVGVVGAIVGFVAGYAAGLQLSDLPMSFHHAQQVFSPTILLVALVAAPLLAGLASWIPALLAAGQDPAVFLTGD